MAHRETLTCTEAGLELDERSPHFRVVVNLPKPAYSLREGLPGHV